MQYETKTHKIHTNETMHNEMGPVWQNPIQRTVRTAHLSGLTTVHSFSTEYNTEQFWHQQITLLASLIGLLFTTNTCTGWRHYCYLKQKRYVSPSICWCHYPSDPTDDIL